MSVASSSDSWQGIVGQSDAVEYFRRALSRGRLASTFLFLGPAGVGKRSFALRLAAVLLCSRRDGDSLAACGQCPSCLQAQAGTHPDLELVAKPPGKSLIPVELFIGRPEHRLQEGLCHRLSLRPYLGERKVAIIDDADFLNVEGANSLLKTLEEPPADSVLILIGTSLDKQLPTIRSRCQLVRFRPLAPEIIVQLLAAEADAAPEEILRQAAAHAGGSLTAAAELARAELWDFRRRLHTALAAPRVDGVALAKMTNAFVDEAGKEASVRRARARHVLGFTLEYWRGCLRDALGLDARAALNAQPASPLPPHLTRADTSLLDSLARRIERSLEALEHIDRNAHLPTLIDAWADDVAR